MSRAALIVVGAAAGVAAWWWSNNQSQAQEVYPDEPAPEPAPSALDQASNFIKVSFGGLMPFSVAKNLPGNREYVEALRSAEIKWGIPAELLVAQAYQESRFNPQAVNAWSGAQGMMQFMPATAAEFNLDPFNPFAAIDAAGRYMAQLYRSTGDWKLALAAYNWGIGNLTRKGISKAPTETKNYMAQISANAGYA